MSIQSKTHRVIRAFRSDWNDPQTMRLESRAETLDAWTDMTSAESWHNFWREEITSQEIEEAHRVINRMRAVL